MQVNAVSLSQAGMVFSKMLHLDLQRKMGSIEENLLQHIVVIMELKLLVRLS